MKFFALPFVIITLSAVTLSASTTMLLTITDVIPPSAPLRDSAARSYGHLSGTVRAVDVLDGQSWIVMTSDGRIYDPVNLPDSLKTEGERISFSYKTAANWGYTYASGELIELTQVSRAR